MIKYGCDFTVDEFDGSAIMFDEPVSPIVTHRYKISCKGKGQTQSNLSIEDGKLYDNGKTKY